jgi:hypothetical protein
MTNSQSIHRSQGQAVELREQLATITGRPQLAKLLSQEDEVEAEQYVVACMTKHLLRKAAREEL